MGSLVSLVKFGRFKLDINKRLGVILTLKLALGLGYFQPYWPLESSVGEMH